MIRSPRGETATARGDWVYEVHAQAAGVDLYREAISWSPPGRAAHAASAGRMLARLHQGAAGYHAAQRTTHLLVARSELVKSSRGAHGGYVLSRPPERISIAQLVDALEDQPFGLTECSATPGVCSFEAACQIRSNWQHINAIVRRTLEEVSVADMLHPLPVDYPGHGLALPQAAPGACDVSHSWSLSK